MAVNVGHSLARQPMSGSACEAECWNEIVQRQFLDLLCACCVAHKVQRPTAFEANSALSIRRRIKVDCICHTCSEVGIRGVAINFATNRSILEGAKT